MSQQSTRSFISQLEGGEHISHLPHSATKNASAVSCRAARRQQPKVAAGGGIVPSGANRGDAGRTGSFSKRAKLSSSFGERCAPVWKVKKKKKKKDRERCSGCRCDCVVIPHRHNLLRQQVSIISTFCQGHLWADLKTALSPWPQ